MRRRARTCHVKNGLRIQDFGEGCARRGAFQPGRLNPALKQSLTPSLRSALNAFEAALGSFGLVERSDPVVTIVARTTFALAKQGERDPVRLSELVIRQMTT
jgi:hypothetical protein